MERIKNGIKKKKWIICVFHSVEYEAYLKICDATNKHSTENLCLFRWFASLVVCLLATKLFCLLSHRRQPYRLFSPQIVVFFFKWIFLCPPFFFSFTQASSKTEARKRKLNKWIKNGKEKNNEKKKPAVSSACVCVAKRKTCSPNEILASAGSYTKHTQKMQSHVNLVCSSFRCCDDHLKFSFFLWMFWVFILWKKKNRVEKRNLKCKHPTERQCTACNNNRPSCSFRCVIHS